MRSSWFSGGLMGCLLLIGLLCGPAINAAPPNVVLILSDDQGWQDYSWMKHPQIRTPHIDRLANESLTYTRGYVPTSLCRPSIACLVTGLAPHQHRIVGNDPFAADGRSPLANPMLRKDPDFQERSRLYGQNLKGVPTLPRLLTTAGYLTHQSGKWWEGSYKDGGFTHGMTLGDASPRGRHGDEGLEIGRKTLQPVLDMMDEARSQNKPFCLFYAPMLPHLPHNPPERLLSKYKDVAGDLPQARYWAMCEWFDETVGQVLAAIDDRGLRDNTVVIYLTDNGWTQPVGTKPGPFGGPRGKTSPYDGGLRTPIMVRWPGKVAPMMDTTTLASSLDVLPTVLKVAGIEAPSGLPGLDLLTLNPEGKGPVRTAVTGANFGHDATLPTIPARTLNERWIVSGEWKLIVPSKENHPERKMELFHITADPFEEQALPLDQPEHQERVAMLVKMLDDWWTP